MKTIGMISKVGLGLMLGLFLLTGMSDGQPGPRKVSNNAFQAGEVVEYRIHYGAVTAGTAKLEVKSEPVTVNGRKCFHMVGVGMSSKAFSLFFKVNDRYETFVDMETLAPHKFKRKIEEGSFKHYSEVEFDQTKHKAYERSTTVPGPIIYDVPAYIQDVMSAFYFARTQDYSSAQPGSVYKFQNFIDKKVHDLDVVFVAREVIDVGGIKYKTVKLKPLVKEGGIFTHEGEMFLWISDDENRIPIRVESGLVIGSVQVDYVKASNLRHPMTSRVR
ncbi:MAG: hypothetical protein RLZZ519_683 [Bacteroidota bacterium]|jgi:hypothetical protein